MRARLSRLDELFRDNAAPADLILDAWAEVEDAVLADEKGAGDAFRAASASLPGLAGAIGERRALATAILSPTGALVWGDQAFRDLIPDSTDLRPLLRRALRDGPVVGLVEGVRGAAFTAWVGEAAAAARWPLSPAAARALASGRRVAVIVSAPSRSSELARRAARALDLTGLEARLAEALLFAPNLDVAAAEAGVGRETARDALRRLNAKAGVKRTPELVARLVEIMCAGRGEASVEDADVAEAAFGLTPAEARVAVLIARGATAPDAARQLGLSPATVKSHLKTAFAKTGARGGKDLARLLPEARELVALADASEPVFAEESRGGRLRIVAARDGARRIALLDYGPPSGEPLLVFHGAAAGRRLPDQLRDRLLAMGYRPMVVQRPGFGLTDPAPRDYVRVGAEDMATIAERLKFKSVSLLARDTGAPVALEFARRYPELVRRGALVNPQAPMSIADERTTFASQVQKHLLRNPELVGPFAEFLRRQATVRVVERVVRRTLGEVTPDCRAIEDPEVMAFLVRDIQALCARSIKGFAAEHAVYAAGWNAPDGMTAGCWTVGLSAELPGHVDPCWLRLPDLSVVRIEGAGVLAQFTHPDEVAALLAPA